MMDMIRKADSQPIVAGATGAGSISFMSIAILSDILATPMKLIVGYPGSRQLSLAVMQGELDVTSIPYESALDRIESGELKPLLQISEMPISDHSALRGVDCLGGADGLAVRRGEQIGKAFSQARHEATALINLIGAGRIIAAPANLGPKEAGCLSEWVYQALTHSEFRQAAAKARRNLNVADAQAARTDLKTAVSRAQEFEKVIRRAIDRLQ
jgi:tripartite-type tricarboxylate transporter receptor subunit TctC